MVKNDLQRVDKKQILGTYIGVLVVLIIGYVVSERVLGRPIRPIEFDMIFILFNASFLGTVFSPAKKSVAYVVSMMLVLGLTVLVRHYVYGMPVGLIILGSIFSMLCWVGFSLFFSRKRTA